MSSPWRLKISDFSAQISGCHSFLPGVPDDVENAFRVVVLREALGDTKNKMYNIYIYIYIYMLYVQHILFVCMLFLPESWFCRK